MIKTQNRLNKYEYTQQVHEMDELSCNVGRESRNATSTSECSPRIGEFRSRERLTRFPCPPLNEISFTGTYPLLCIKGINDIRTPEKEAVRAALRMPPRQSFPLGNMDLFLKGNTDPSPPPVALSDRKKILFSCSLPIRRFFKY
jgi:hypothetical protein